MLKASAVDKKSVLKFWGSGGKKGKQQPDPAVLSIIASHKTGDRSMDEAEISDRLFLPMLLEATRVLEEGIVREPADVDMGLILGIGFPPFKGGHLPVVRYARRGRRSRAAGASMRHWENDSSRPRRWFNRHGQARLFIRGPSWPPTPEPTPGREGIDTHENAVVIDAVRTPIGRASADKGYFRDVRSEDLSAHVISRW